MLEQIFTQWWSIVAAYVVGPMSLLAGQVSVYSLLPVAGLLLLVVGLVLIGARREKQAVWLLPPFIVTLLSPIVLGLFNGMLGWIGMLFAFVIGTILLLVWIGSIAANATHRLPVWLVGWAFVTFVVFAGFVNIVFTWGIG